MARIPKWDGRMGQQIETSGTAPTVNFYVPPARTDPLVGTGEAISDASRQVASIYIANEERKAASYTTKSSAGIQEFVVTNMTKAKQEALAQGNVEGFTENFLKQYDEVVKQAIDSAPNNLAKEALGERMMSARNALLEDSMSFEAKAKVQIYENNLNKAVDAYAKTAATDPKQLPQILKQLQGDVAAAQATLGLPEAEKRLKAYSTEITSTAISQAIKTNPYQAEGLINQYKDALEADDFVSLSNNAKKAQQALVKQAEQEKAQAQRIASVWGAVNGGLPLSTSSKESNLAVEEFYSKVKQKDPNADITDVVVATNIMPKALKEDLTSKLTGGTTEQKVAAAQQIEYLRERAPNSVAKITQKEKAKASLITSYIEAGIEPKKAAEWAEKENGAIDSEVIKKREKAAKKESALEFKAAESNFTGWFGSGKEAIPEEMKVEYETLAKAYYINEGLNPEQAQKNALNDIRAMWSKSSVTGRSRFMKNAPETIFKNNAGTEWIGKQLQEDLKVKKTDNIVLEANPVMSRNNLPVYNVYQIDEKTGVIDAMMDKDGQPILFQPDFEQSSTYKEMLDKVEGETFEQKKEKYIKETEKQQLKQLRRGQEPSLEINPVMPFWF